jgi:hypothetical protein
MKLIHALSESQRRELVKVRKWFSAAPNLTVAKRWYSSIAISELEESGARALLRLANLLDRLVEVGDPHFVEFEKIDFANSASTDSEAIPYWPASFAHLQPIVLKHQVVWGEQNIVDYAHELPASQRAELLQVRDGMESVKDLDRWLKKHTKSPAWSVIYRFRLLLDSLGE